MGHSVVTSELESGLNIIYSGETVLDDMDLERIYFEENFGPKYDEPHEECGLATKADRS